MPRFGRLRAPSALLAVATMLATAVLATGCGRAGSSASGAGDGRLQIVAAENFWGSIAAQLAGVKADVTSIIVNPASDPHSYEPTAADARAMAGARIAIVNGLGYDSWAPRLLRASPSGDRVVLDVGKSLGLAEGANPHQWYSPSAVHRFVDALVADYERLDPSATSYFAQRKQTFLTRDLARYDALRRQIRARYAGTPVGYSESIFRPLGEDLQLKLSTPYSFAKAIAEGDDVTAADKRTVDDQARKRLIKIWVFNSQNVTPDVQRVNQIAQERRIPIATVTETLSPAGESFEQWQSSELEGLARALHEATGR